MQRRLVPWRLIDTGPGDGATNMAVDEALLENFDPVISSPVLRLYGWEPAALSIGRFQKAAEVLDLARCAACGVAVVRRITGGGVIFHADELTYALVCAPGQIPPAPSVKESFRVLTAFLLRFYRRLGLNPLYAADAATDGSRLGARHPFCFAGRESYDILIDGEKIGGNAQRRLKAAIFQHGSVPLLDRSPEGRGYLLDPSTARGAAAGSLAGAGVNLPAAELKRCMAESFAEALGVELRPDGLSDRERASVCRLLGEKYRDPGWNMDAPA